LEIKPSYSNGRVRCYTSCSFSSNRGNESLDNFVVRICYLHCICSRDRLESPYFVCQFNKSNLFVYVRLERLTHELIISLLLPVPILLRVCYVTSNVLFVLSIKILIRWIMFWCPLPTEPAPPPQLTECVHHISLNCLHSSKGDTLSINSTFHLIDFFYLLIKDVVASGNLLCTFLTTWISLAVF